IGFVLIRVTISIGRIGRSEWRENVRDDEEICFSDVSEYSARGRRFLGIHQCQETLASRSHISEGLHLSLACRFKRLPVQQRRCPPCDRRGGEPISLAQRSNERQYLSGE